MFSIEYLRPPAGVEFGGGQKDWGAFPWKTALTGTPEVDPWISILEQHLWTGIREKTSMKT